MCADKSVRYGWERSPIDRCAVLLRSLAAIGCSVAALLRVIGGPDLVGTSLCWYVERGCDISGLWSIGGWN